MKKPSVKKLEDLWKKVVKARAGYKSELGGDVEGQQLHAHHIMGKPNYRLRFELDNGICINGGQHFQAGDAYTCSEIRKQCLKVRGVSEEKLKMLGRQVGGTDLFLVELYLKRELKKWTKTS